MTKNSDQSQAGVIRQHLVWIEGQLAIGIRQESIVSNLTAKGVQISLKNFRNELWRARKKRAASQTPGESSKAIEGKIEAKCESVAAKPLPSQAEAMAILATLIAKTEQESPFGRIFTRKK